MTALQGLFVYLVIALTILFLFAIFQHKRPDTFFDQGYRRRSGDLKYSKGQPGAVLQYRLDDGIPCGRRGRIWDEHERDIYAQRKRNNVIRIRGDG